MERGICTTLRDLQEIQDNNNGIQKGHESIRKILCERGFRFKKCGVDQSVLERLDVVEACARSVLFNGQSRVSLAESSHTDTFKTKSNFC